MLYDIPKSEQKYEIYEPLHRMWIGYIQEVLRLKEEGGTGLKWRGGEAMFCRFSWCGAGGCEK